MNQSELPFAYEVHAASQADVDELKRMRLALQAHFARANPHLLAPSAQRVATLTAFYSNLLVDP